MALLFASGSWFLYVFRAFFDVSRLCGMRLSSILGWVYPMFGLLDSSSSSVWFTVLMTMIFFLGTTVTWAHYAILQDIKNLRLRHLVTWFSGVVLVFCVQHTYAHFGFTQGLFASTFYMATGFRLLRLWWDIFLVFVLWLNGAFLTLEPFLVWSCPVLALCGCGPLFLFILLIFGAVQLGSGIAMQPAPPVWGSGGMADVIEACLKAWWWLFFLGRLFVSHEVHMPEMWTRVSI